MGISVAIEVNPQIKSAFGTQKINNHIVFNTNRIKINTISQ